MKTGNSSQALILSVVAIGAIGFLVTRLIPAKASTPAESAATGTSSTGKLASLDGLPTDIVRDAFSHPALLKRMTDQKATENLPAAQDADADLQIAPAKVRGPIGKVLPAEGVRLSAILQKASELPEAKPSGNTEKDQQVEKQPSVKIVLKAIMRATKPIALISMDGKSELLVSPGDQLTADYRVGKFSENGVQLLSTSGSFWLMVGKEVQK